jgi:hypothetical protein
MGSAAVVIGILVISMHSLWASEALGMAPENALGRANPIGLCHPPGVGRVGGASARRIPAIWSIQASA